MLPILIIVAVLLGVSLIRVPAAINATVDVGRPAVEVFEYISDPRQLPTFNVRQGEVRNWSGPMEVGSRWQLVFPMGNGREAALDYTCVAYEQNRLVSETRSRRMRSQVIYEVQPWGDSCQVSVRSIALVPPLQSLLIHSPHGQRRIRDEVENLKLSLDGPY